MKDDAVAPVIAVMLILAAAVVFLSVWNAVYIPSLKQSSEADHIRNVQSAFLHFASDIETAVSLRQDDLVLSEPVQLGGGDCLFNTIKSGGSLYIENEPEPAYNLSFYNTSGVLLGEMNGTLATVTFTPVGNFWQDQGYRWQHGYLNVTKYGTRQAPLSYYNMTDVTNAFEGNGSLAPFAGSFANVGYSLNQTLFPIADGKGNITAYLPRDGNCSTIAVTAVNMTASPDHPFTSGNGFGTLRLTTTVKTTDLPDIAVIAVSSPGQPFGNRTLDRFNTGFIKAGSACSGNINYLGSIGDVQYLTINQQISPVKVALTSVEITIGAY